MVNYLRRQLGEVMEATPEKCPHCRKLFTVSGWSDDNPGNAWFEPIDCPWCEKTVRRARNDSGLFRTTKVEKAPRKSAKRA
jgi:glutaredoxin